MLLVAGTGDANAIKDIAVFQEVAIDVIIIAILFVTTHANDWRDQWTGLIN